MEILKYEIKQGDTLQSIAERYAISAEELVDFHNSKANMTQQIYGDQISIHINLLFVHFDTDRKKQNKSVKEEMHLFQSARYRCEQIKISRINNEVITLSASTLSEYLLTMDQKDKGFVKVDLVDSNFTVDPLIYKNGFEFSLKLEKLRTPITLKLSEEGKVEEIINMSEVLSRWEKFRDNDLSGDTTFGQMQTQAPNQAQDLISTGNKEFASQIAFCKTLDKNLFFHIAFKSLNNSALEEYEFEQMSQIFPNVNLRINVVKSLVTENEEIITFRFVGTLDKAALSLQELEKMYSEIYQPIIKYNFTEFDFIYRITFTINKATGFITEGRAAISEKIKNNYEITTEFSVKKVEL